MCPSCVCQQLGLAACSSVLGFSAGKNHVSCEGGENSENLVVCRSALVSHVIHVSQDRLGTFWGANRGLLFGYLTFLGVIAPNQLQMPAIKMVHMVQDSIVYNRLLISTEYLHCASASFVFFNANK